MSSRFSGKVVIVTGGASGFGEAFTARFVEEGARVVVADLDDANGERVVAQAREGGGEAEFVRTDVTSGGDVTRLVATAKERFGRVDVLMNNAGIASPRVPIEDVDEALFDRLFAVNVKGVYLLCRNVVPVMKAGGGGVIINTASTSALRPRPLNAAYAASKAAVITLTKALALELSRDRIRVNALTPVAADTPLFRAFTGDDESLAESIAAQIPMGRLCHPRDMAECALFLASDQAAFLTGVSLPVDGGWTAG